MKTLNVKMTACAFAAAALLAACGGGGTTPDTTAPTLAITDNVDGTATTPVTFTFTFSEMVTGFTAEDITVSNGTKGDFNMDASGRSATLVVTPSSGNGTIEVSVAAGAFADTAGNTSTASANATQAFGAATPEAFISFDESPEIVTGIGAYGGALPEVTNGPSGGSAKALKIAKPVGTYIENNVSVNNQNWGGTYFNVPRVPFTSAKKAITARVYSTVANAVIRLKVEVQGGASVEVAGTTVTQANTWTTVTWNFSAADVAANYTVLAITPDVDRALDGAVYYLDDINVVDTPAPTSNAFPLTFDDASSSYTFTGFGGADDSALADDPTTSSNKVGRAIKTDTAELWAGTTFSTGSNNSISVIPFSNTQTSLRLRVYSPVANIPVRLKVEDASDPTKSVETEATVTQANSWQTLTFNFANQATGTAALNLGYTYNKVSVFFNFGTSGAQGGGGTFYFDDLSIGN